MRYVVHFCIICTLFILAIPAVGAASSGDNEVIPIPGQYIVRFADDARLDAVASGFGLSRLGIPSVERVFDDFQADEVRPLFPTRTDKSDEMSRFYLVRIEDKQREKQFVESLLANPNVLSVEQDIMCRVRAEPNDPGRTSQWWVYQASRKDIHAYEAWDKEPGCDTVILAIMDTGVNYLHSDLKNNIWINPGEDIDGDMVVFDSTDFNTGDDDGNGYTDDVIGYDFFAGGSATPWPGEDGTTKDNDPSDFNGHGTHCAGIAGASTNNAIGGAGTCGGWGTMYYDRGVQIMCLRVGYSAVDPDDGTEAGLVVMSAVAEAVNYAVDNGADIISFSAGSSFTSALNTAMHRVNDSGIVFVEAAGNDGADSPSYLGTYTGVLSVANTDSDDEKYGSSNFGTWVDLAAPGSQIYSTYSDHYTATYATLWGTSMSAPMVAGAAAIIKSHYPALDKTTIDTILVNRADSIDDPYYLSGQLGGGRLNLENCLAGWPSALFSASIQYGAPPLTVTFTDNSIDATSWDWDFGDAGSSTDQNPMHTYTSPGYYDVSLTIDGPSGSHFRNKKRLVYVTADTFYAAPQSAQLGADVEVVWNLKNSVPVDEFTVPVTFPATGSPVFVLDSFTVAGTRTEDFDYVDNPGQSSSKAVFVFKAAQTTGKNALPPGDGPILKMYFSTSGAGTAKVDTTTFGSSYSFQFKNRFTVYKPTVVPASVLITLYQRGDANGDTSINVGDAVYLISYIFKGGLPPIDYPTVYAGDANADGGINIGDPVYLINYIFKGGPPPPP
ncbi:MAG: S8 family serine peptidase [Candidatus Zixiibacteriota bacterium]